MPDEHVLVNDPDVKPARGRPMIFTAGGDEYIGVASQRHITVMIHSFIHSFIELPLTKPVDER